MTDIDQLRTEVARMTKAVADLSRHLAPWITTAEQMRAYAATDNKALRAELANARAADIHSCHAGCTRAGCVNARLREDAERYRWLTSGEHGSKRDDWIWDCVLTEDQRKGHNDIDAAIDAARKATP